MASNNKSEEAEILSSNSQEILNDQQTIPNVDVNDCSSTNELSNTQDVLVTAQNRPTGQTAIGAKIIKKLEKIANSKESKSSGDKTSTVTNDENVENNTSPSDVNRQQEVKQNKNEIIESLMGSLTDSDPQKNISTLAMKLAELQEQNRLTQSKIAETDKKSIALARERDQVLLENSRISASKTKLESLCRELHKHNQQIRDDSIQKQQDDESKREELAQKFQSTIEEITSQLSNYSAQSSSLQERNRQLSEQLASVVNDCELREKEFDETLKKKDLELRLAEANLQESHLMLSERTELIKQERQVSEAQRLVLYKNCEELAMSEAGLRSQLKVYAERYQEFQDAIQQSGQMVTACRAEIEKMEQKIKNLEQERIDFRDRWNATEQSLKKTNEQIKSTEKEKRQLDIKLDKLDRLCRTLQQERTNLQVTVKNLSKSTNASKENDVSNSAREDSPSTTDKITNPTVPSSSLDTPASVDDS